jgi:hypothetical protein
MTLTIFATLSGRPVRIDVPEGRHHDRAKRQVCKELDRLAEIKRAGRLKLISADHRHS